MSVESNFFVDFEKIILDCRDSVTAHILKVSRARWRNKRYIESKTAQNVAVHYRVARKAFDAADSLARICDKSFRCDAHGNVCVRKLGNIARFIKPMHFDAELVKHLTVTPADVYYTPVHVDENTFGPLYRFTPEQFKDAVTAAAQFAFNKLIAARLFEENLCAELSTNLFQVDIFFDHSEYHLSERGNDAVETRLFRVTLECLPRDDFIRADFRRSMIGGEPGKILHTYGRPDLQFQTALDPKNAHLGFSDTVESVIQEGVKQGRANLIKFALERKYA